MGRRPVIQTFQLSKSKNEKFNQFCVWRACARARRLEGDIEKEVGASLAVGVVERAAGAELGSDGLISDLSCCGGSEADCSW